MADHEEDTQETTQQATESDIPSIVEEKKPFPNWIIWALCGFGVVAILFIGPMLDGDAKEEKEEKIEFTGDDKQNQRRENSRTPQPPPVRQQVTVVPSHPNEQRATRPPVPGREQNAASQNPQKDARQLQMERQAAQRAEQLRQQRLNSPLLIVDDVGTKEEQQLEQQTQMLQDRQQALLDKADRALDIAEGGSRPARFGPQTAGRTEFSSMGDVNVPKPEQVQATVLQNRGAIITEGTIIRATLETAINSDLPGKLRAVVAEPIYSSDGNRLLLPSGSMAIGEYTSGLQEGQTRIFAIWSRVITPDGIDIQISSPGTDMLGRSGHSGWVDSHFFKRFGASALLSIINAAAQNEADNQQQIDAINQEFSRASEIALENSIDIPPTVHKNQGDIINIFVAKDLNFKQALASLEHTLKTPRPRPGYNYRDYDNWK